MARAYAELFDARPLRLTTFANDEGYGELVLARAIPFRTVCEHHLLPFSGVAHVGYLPGERIVGLSKLARLVEHFAARPQVQERLTKQVAECLATRLRAPGVGVVLEAEHSCMALRDLTTHDVRLACDVLRPAYDASDGVDGRASIEVDPRLAYDTEATIAEARALWWRVDRPNLFIKIAAAREALPAITACLAEGISVNVTLIFSLTRYDEVIDAFLEGLERARQAGHDLAQIASVASFFVSRVDTEVDARLAKTGTAEAAALRGRAAIANARLAYQRYEQMLASPRWAALAAAGARPQRPLWASTSVKDPAYSDTMYVTKLVAPDVVNTMPEATLRAVADHR